MGPTRGPAHATAGACSEQRARGISRCFANFVRASDALQLIPQLFLNVSNLIPVLVHLWTNFPTSRLPRLKARAIPPQPDGTRARAVRQYLTLRAPIAVTTRHISTGHIHPVREIPTPPRPKEWAAASQVCPVHHRQSLTTSPPAPRLGVVIMKDRISKWHRDVCAGLDGIHRASRA